MGACDHRALANGLFANLHAMHPVAHAGRTCITLDPSLAPVEHIYHQDRWQVCKRLYIWGLDGGGEVGWGIS